jgi:hypothetical protein
MLGLPASFFKWEFETFEKPHEKRSKVQLHPEGAKRNYTQKEQSAITPSFITLRRSISVMMNTMTDQVTKVLITEHSCFMTFGNRMADGIITSDIV